MSAREEINAKYTAEHAQLEKRYYQTRELTKEQFDTLHADLWKRHEEELIAAGFRKRLWTYTFVREAEKKKEAKEYLDFTFERELTSEEITDIQKSLQCKFESASQSSVDVK